MNGWRTWLLGLLAVFSNLALAVDPVCDTTWTKTSSSWTCNGNGKVTFSSNTSFVPTGNLTLIANNGFVLSGNIVGSANIRVNFESSYGDYSISGSTVYGNLTASSGTYSISSSTVNGSITTGGNITLTSTTVTGLVTSSSNTITATNSNLQAGLTSRSGITLSGGTVNGAITMTARNIVRLTGVTMPTGSISGASSVYLDNSDLGSASANVNVTTDSNDIYVQGGSVIYGNLSAAVNSNGTVQVQSGSVYGTCLPKSNPVNACNATPPASVHHYELSYASPGVTCEAEPVTIKACTNAACTTLYSGTTSVTLAATNGGSWTNSSPTFSAGSASSALRKTSTGSSVISLSAASPTASNALECKNSGVIDSSCSISFADTGLKIYATDGANQIAGQGFNAQLRAIRTNTNTGACEARVQGSRPVRLAYRCVDPTTCITTQKLNINGNNGAGGTDLNGTAAASSLVYQSTTLTFDASGSAPLGLFYPDVGRIELNAELTLAASGTDPNITLTAPASAFVIRPYEIRVSAVTQATGTGANPETTSAGQGFLAAGSPFKVRLDVLNKVGNFTPNFNKEIAAETLSVEFVSLVYPSGGAGNSSNLLTNSGNFTAVAGTPGQFENLQLRWLEAGSIKLRGKLSDNSYLGSGDVSLKPDSAIIGRFYPQHFVLSNPSSANLCGSGSTAFSYMSQPGVPLNFTLEAVNLANSRLLNYHSSSDSANYTGAAGIGLVAENNGSTHTPDLGSRLTGQPSPTWQQGRYQFSASILQLARGSSVDGPFLNFQPGIKVLAERDNRNLASNLLTMNAATSGVCAGTACDAAKLGNELKFYYGRHRLENAYANAFQAASVVLKAEVWNGSQFVLHSADSCSDVMPAALTATGTPALTVSGSNTKLAAGVNPTNTLLLSAPGQNGSWGLQYQAPVWLKYNWNTSTAGDEDPSATALFGRYRGNDRLIYQREQ
jgi:MSHA biogenesis protein MshQ